MAERTQDVTIWHVCNTIFPRRTIDGKWTGPLGKTWRRWRDGRWEYQQDAETTEEMWDSNL
jgi:hypothetical protein